MVLDISKPMLKNCNSGKYATLKVLEIMYIKGKRKIFWGKIPQKEKERPSCYRKIMENTKSRKEKKTMSTFI